MSLKLHNFLAGRGEDKAKQKGTRMSLEEESMQHINEKVHIFYFKIMYTKNNSENASLSFAIDFLEND